MLLFDIFVMICLTEVITNRSGFQIRSKIFLSFKTGRWKLTCVTKIQWLLGNLLRLFRESYLRVITSPIGAIIYVAKLQILHLIDFWFFKLKIL